MTLEQLSLAEAVRETEEHVATGGWDGPVRVFALVRTADAVRDSPGLAEQVPEAVAAGRANPFHLMAVEQEDLPHAPDLEGLLALLSWPPTVHGAAVVVERYMLPPDAEASLPADPDQALAYLESHPDREEVRIAAGVLRNGPAWCAVRTRSHDDAASVAFGPDLVPGLVAAVRATLQ